MQKINVKAMGLSFGVVWGFAIFLTAILAMLFNIGTNFITIFADFYFGYDATLLGSIVGAFWGFIDGFIGGILLAWLYNKFARA